MQNAQAEVEIWKWGRLKGDDWPSVGPKALEDSQPVSKEMVDKFGEAFVTK